MDTHCNEYLDSGPDRHPLDDAQYYRLSQY
jgi:hypothetical protein